MVTGVEGVVLPRILWLQRSWDEEGDAANDLTAAEVSKVEAEVLLLISWLQRFLGMEGDVLSIILPLQRSLGWRGRC